MVNYFVLQQFFQNYNYLLFNICTFFFSDIILPSAQYTVQISDFTIIQLNEQNASVTGLKLGQAKVQLVDYSIFSED